MSDRSLVFDSGPIRFAWLITAREIEVYALTEAGAPERRLGMLTTITDAGCIVPFEQEAFEEHCRWFLEIASTAETRTEP